MTDARALKAVQDAFYSSRYVLSPHALKRMLERRISFHEIKEVAMKAKRIEAYVDPKRTLPPGVSSWRLTGTDFDGEPLAVAVDLTVDHLGGFVVVVTVF